MDYFFDEYEQDEINALEKKFTDCVENLMRVVEAELHNDEYRWMRKYRSVKYRNWKMSVYSNWFVFRGRLSSNVTLYKMESPEGSFLHVDRLCFEYYPNNILLRAVCYAFDIDSAAKFDKFISVLNAASVSMV